MFFEKLIKAQAPDLHLNENCHFSIEWLNQKEFFLYDGL